MAKKKIDPVAHQQSLIKSGIRDMENLISQGSLTTPPKHRKFKVGERIRYGAHQEVYVREVYRDDMYYLVECLNVIRDRNKPAANEFHVQAWHEFLPFSDKGTTFRKEEKSRIRLMNSGVDSMLHMIHHSGVDMDVEYQREHVWTTADKVALIDSIFNNIDIGKIVFVQRDFSVTGKLYEILDGKQRLTALQEFYEDRFKYKGFYYSELSALDRNKFENHGITYGYLENPNKEAIFETFIKLNTCGKPMASKHIDKVKYLLKEYNEVKEQIAEKLKENGY